MRVYLLFLLFISLASHAVYAQQTEDLFGSYIYADDKISLNLSPPNAYTLFQMEQDRRTGAVTSRELSRGTFEVVDGKVLLEEFPTRDEMRLEVNAEMVLQAENVKGLEQGEILRAWSMQYENGQTRVEGEWKKDKRHGTWVYYDEEGDLIKSEKYRRGKLID